MFLTFIGRILAKWNSQATKLAQKAYLSDSYKTTMSNIKKH